MQAVGRTDYCRQIAKLHIFPNPTAFLNRIQYHSIIAIWVGFGMQAANTPVYPVMFRFPLYVTLCDYNPQRDRGTNVMLDVVVV